MKRAIKTFIISIATIVLYSCGEDRSQEFYELTKENQWVYSKMKEVYLWADSIKPVSQRTYFNTPSKFFTSLLYKGDATSTFSKAEIAETYGFTFSLMRDPLGIAPAKVYALVEYVEPTSVAAVAGLERGMWISTINGNNINMGTGSALAAGEVVTFGVNAIIYNDDTEEYTWEQLPSIEMQAATPTTVSPVPVTGIISDNSGKTGYILCNNFDDDTAVETICSTLSGFDAEGVANIVIDLRYFTGTSLTNAAIVAATLVPANKRGTPFCSLYKDLKLTEKEEIPFPQTSINIGRKPLYIITTTKTTGVATVFIKALHIACGTENVKIVGESAIGANFTTESIESPYQFSISPVTAIIADANGELLAPIIPDFSLNEIGDYRHIYPLGNKQEHMLYNITYIIANGVLPADI